MDVNEKIQLSNRIAMLEETVKVLEEAVDELRSRLDHFDEIERARANNYYE